MALASILGIGVHTTLGFGLDQHFDALQQAPHAAPPLRVYFAGATADVPCHILADAPIDQTDLLSQERRVHDIVARVVDAALTQAGLSAAQRHRTAIFLGSSSFDISMSEARYQRELQTDIDALPLSASSAIGNLALSIAKRFALHGPDFSFNSACTASANALLYAAQMVANGAIDHAVVIGVELANITTLLGFHSLGLLTDQLMRPFDQQRGGLAIGEGCTAVVVGNAAQRSDLYVCGGANLCDTHSISAANPDGSTIDAVMQQALTDAALAASDISAIKTHGTASLLNDEAEAAGLKRTFATLPTLCALKPYIGHTLGACGLSELALFHSLLRTGHVPATIGICAEPGDLGIVFPQAPVAVAPGYFMLNYFGFGGSNTSLIVTNREL
jgi:3-oxoacyl-[acyl-carrier-protein] synthase-1